MAYHNTILTQIVALFPRHEFESLARKHHIGEKFRSFNRWSQFLAMVVAQRKRDSFIFALISAVFFWYAPAPAQTITLAADEWPPFNTRLSHLGEGYIVDAARKIFEPQGYTVVYENMPWKRALEMTKAGKIDGAIGASKNDGIGLIFPTEELARTKMAFYVRRGNPWRFTERSSVSQVTIGAIAGYDYRNWLNTYINNNRDNFTKVQVITGDEPLKRNLTKLILERIDVVVDNEAVIQYVAKKIGISEKIACAGHDSEPSMLYIAFSPHNPQSPKYAEMLSQGIIRLRENGELKKILDKYGVSDWK